MKKNIVTLTVIVAIGLATLLVISPVWRTIFGTAVEDLTQWTPAAIEKNPIGYSQFVEAQLKKDLKIFQETRKALALRMEILAKLLIEKTSELGNGETFANEFAEAITDGTFPAKLHGRDYTESQLRIQLSLTLAQVNGLKESVAEITKVSVTAEKELQKLVVETEKTESQIALLATRREIFRSQATSAEGLEMIATVNSVLEGNQILIKANPVRTIDELLRDVESESTSQGVTPSEIQVSEFLQSFVAKKSSKGDLFQTKDIPLAPGDKEKE